jgi:hypothetical protein
VLVTRDYRALTAAQREAGDQAAMDFMLHIAITHAVIQQTMGH